MAIKNGEGRKVLPALHPLRHPFCRQNSDEPTQSEEVEAQGLDAPSLLEIERQGDGAVEWSCLKTLQIVRTSPWQPRTTTYTASLRACRVWNKLSTPPLFWRVNLQTLIVPHRIILLLRGFDKHIVKHYGSLIHAMTLNPHPNFRVLGARKLWRPEAAQYDCLLGSIIRQCPNLKFLRLEYLFRRRTPLLHAAIVDLAERGDYRPFPSSPRASWPTDGYP